MILTEAFPPTIIGVCIGIIESLAQVGSFMGPIVVSLCINMKIYPTIALSVLIIFTTVIPFFGMVETKPVI